MNTTDALPRIRLHGHAPKNDTFLEEVRAGLQAESKHIPCKFFYDAEGSRLFDRICELEAYYPTRTELAIMEAGMDEIVGCIGPRVRLVEYGSGSSLKTRLLLEHLHEPVAYVPIDISGEHLMRSARAVAADHPGLQVAPVCADYTADFDLPPVEVPAERTVIYFPGSTIGNFTPERAEAFLGRMARVCGAGGGLLIGVDLRKDERVLEAAYDDDEGVTAAFNKNVLARINRELGADFHLDRFAHEALYDAVHHRVEMHLVSLAEQSVRLDGVSIPFRRGERICTEYSYKYSLHDFAALARRAGFDVERVWTDPKRYFSVQYLAAR